MMNKIVGLSLLAVLAMSVSMQVLPCLAEPDIYNYGYYLSNGGRSVLVQFQVVGIRSNDKVSVKGSIQDLDVHRYSQAFKHFGGTVGSGPHNYNVRIPCQLVEGHSYTIKLWIIVPNRGGWTPNYVQFAEYNFRT